MMTWCERGQHVAIQTVDLMHSYRATLCFTVVFGTFLLNRFVSQCQACDLNMQTQAIYSHVRKLGH